MIKFTKESKTKIIWACSSVGYDFNKSSDLKNTKLLEAAKRILKYKKVLINGISEKTLKSL